MIIIIIYKTDNRNTTVLTNQCGAPGIECDDDSVCVLEGIVNRCVESKTNKRSDNV